MKAYFVLCMFTIGTLTKALPNLPPSVLLQTKLPDTAYDTDIADETVTENIKPDRRSFEEEGDGFNVERMTKAKITRGRLAEENPNVKGLGSGSIINGLLTGLIILVTLAVFYYLFAGYIAIRKNFSYFTLSQISSEIMLSHLGGKPHQHFPFGLCNIYIKDFI